MITRWTAKINRALRCLSPTEWFVRWLDLPKSDSSAHDRGLVLIQIDGLSHPQLRRALDAGRMPFLRSLLNREHYQLHDLYSGLPSSTPSVQGELFYGKRCAVPAFGFRDHRSGRMVSMFARDAASDVEHRMQVDPASIGDPGLLANGSAYCNIYGGGAKETHFCASSLGWDELFTDKPWKLSVFLVWHVWSIGRMLGLLGVEFILSIGGFLRGTLRRREYLQELMMIPARVVVVILLRELATIGASLDVTRGLPIVQLNLMGYDEQAHRRGPQSKFAHWTLKGIDDAIKRLWKASHRSAGREYDVWVYSDHGQETTIPYEYVAGRRIAKIADEVVTDVCGEASVSKVDDRDKNHPSGDLKYETRESGRARWLGASWIVSKLFGGDDQTDSADQVNVQVAALGPLGLIYINREVSASQRLAIAERFAMSRSVPIAFVRQSDSALAITEDGTFDLRTEPERVFGSEHPFLTAVADDMITLCHHPDAGDVVLSSWVCNGDSLSFATQNGAHAGPGVQETHAFVLLPSDVSAEADRHIRNRGKTYLRPDDLRHIAGDFLRRPRTRRRGLGNVPASVFPRAIAPWKVLTYNVHACVGMDGQLSPRRIARVIAQSGADVVALQELDVFRARSGRCDQAEEIAAALKMECYFHPAWAVEDELYGDAILSRWPLRLLRKGELPSASERHEPRGAIWAEVILPDGHTVQILNTHLSIYPTERNLQAAAFAKDWVQPAMQRGSTIVCGDFNATPRSSTYKCFRKLLDDAQSVVNGTIPASTWFSTRPLARIDHIFISDGIHVDSTRVSSSRLARIASDHLPLLAELRVANPTSSNVARSCNPCAE